LPLTWSASAASRAATRKVRWHGCGLWSDLIAPTIAVHNGRVVKRTGDGSIIEFRSVVDAVRCAIEVQNGMVERNAELPPERRIEFRIGIHLGDVVEESDGDLMGDGVNIAALKALLNRAHFSMPSVGMPPLTPVLSDRRCLR
jgi:class 3 adenylate cyclase